MIGKSGKSIEVYHGQPCWVAAYGRWYKAHLFLPNTNQNWKQVSETYITALVSWKMKNGREMKKRMRVYEDSASVLAYHRRSACLNRPSIPTKMSSHPSVVDRMGRYILGK